MEGERASRWAALWLLCLAFFVDVMGSTSVFAAAPSIQHGLRLSQSALQWSIIAATLPGGALLLVGGRCADLFGRRRMFAIGLGLLVVAWLGCGLAASAAMLIAARVVLGVGGALLLPAALSLLMGTFVEQAERNRALGVWSAIGGIGATAGLLVGGAVTAGAGWRWMFLANVPVVLVMLALSPALLEEPASEERSRALDLPGLLLFCGALALLTYAVGEVPAVGWLDPRTLGTACAGVLAAAAFVRLELTSDHAVLPRRLLRARSVRAGNLTLVVAGMCVDGLLFALTLYTQKAEGYSALQFGAVTAVMTVCAAGAAGFAQRAVTRFGAGRVAGAGMLLLTLTGGAFAVATAVDGSLVLLIAGMVVFGLGMGCAFTSGSVAALEGVEEGDAGVAAAVQNISFGTGTTLGVSILSTVVGAAAGHGGAVVTGAALAGAARAAFVAAAAIAVAGLIALATLSLRGARAAYALGR